MSPLFGKTEQKQEVYPFIVIRKAVVFPRERIALILEGKETVEAINSAFEHGRSLVLGFKKNGEASEIGTLASIHNFGHLSSLIVGIEVEGIERVRIVDKVGGKGSVKAKVEIIKAGSEGLETTALSRSVFDQFKKIIEMEGMMPFALASEIQKGDVNAATMSDMVASALSLNFQEKLELLETLDVKKRLEILDLKLTKELKVVEAKKKIQQEVEKKLSKEQREYILREQLKEIEKELGLYKEEKEYETLEKKIRAAGMPKETEERIFKEFVRFRSMPPMSAEVSYIRAYLDWMVDLPWNRRTEEKLDLKKAKEILDQDHYGLQKTKERVLEFLAVQKLTGGKGRGTIMCFVGPPGTGKTSVGKSIARALNRRFVRISLGGVRDEAEIRGHRRTYVGALPGRIIQQMKAAGTKNPVFMLDEIDKMGADFRGDPASAMLEVLDPEQNNSFSDHYLEVPFDLSEVLFITTANILDTIPPPLRDRMEIIEFPGYTDEEKFYIAKQFLLPKIFSSHGLTGEQLFIGDEALNKIISKYTREAGIRNLERKISEIARKVAEKIVEGRVNGKVAIGENDLFKYLGPEVFKITMREAQDEVGTSTGLAWTPAGGEIIFIEASVVPGGKGHLTLTGQLGNVMKESAMAALSYLRSRNRELNFSADFFRNSDVHVHVPSGAVPKDGPSAGVAIATALASVLTGRKVKKEVGMTGEVTLSGKVLPIGGVKEKVLAAHRAGVEIVVLPADNEMNLYDVPEETKKALQFKFVRHMDEVLDVALHK